MIKLIHWLVIAAFIAMTIWLAFTPSQVVSYVAPVATTTPEVVVKPVPTTNAILEAIARCESGGRQFNDDGTVIRGKVNPQDVGKWQINEHYHLKESQRLGYDIYTLEGNTEYALYLYKKQGSKPWGWSRGCHGY